jgi:5-methylcytosine-specific restriction endonuclease McrA
VNSTGDGILATFDGPGRAVRAARAISEKVRACNLEIRAGLHTGEVERSRDDVAGIAVPTAGVMAHAGAGEDPRHAGNRRLSATLRVLSCVSDHLLRTWIDELGMRRGSFSLLPEMGETFERRLRAEMERMWKAGSREGTTEQRAHDAFVSMLEGQGRPGRRPDFVAVYDVREGSTHIPGVGPLDDETTRAAARDAIVWAVLHDGQKVSDIVRFGDYVPRPLEVLLEIGHPPHLEGVQCADCGATFAFERDHVDPRANGGPTSNANLEPRCPPCHRAKTERDREAGRLGKNPPRRRPGGGRSRPKRASAARGVGTSRAGP